METTLPLMLDGIARKYPDIPAQYFRINEKTPVFESLSYRELMNIALNFAGGLLSLGVRRGDPVGLIADNRREWLQMDMGIMAIGAVDVPRGCDAVESELGFILASTECGTVIAENAAQVCKILALKSQLPKLQQIITMDTVEDPEVIALVRKHAVGLFAFEEVQKAGIEYNQKNPGLAEEEMRKGCGDDLACIIFTSGTTGEPKGVMLTHHNFLAQLDELPERIYLHPGDRALLVLPVWHVFERLCEYVIICQGGSLCYSKPIGSVMLPDMQELNPQLMPAVPRVFEAVYEAVNRTMRKTGGVVFVLYKFFLGAAKLQSAIHRRLFRKTARFRNDHILLSWVTLVVPWLLLYPVKALGGVLVFKKIRAKVGTGWRAGISGGGALPPPIDAFFWAVGVKVVEGYGLTETAPVVAVRPIGAPVFGTIGTPIRRVEVRIVDDRGSGLGVGKTGELQVRGETVMKGYFKRDDLTRRAVSDEGWLSTGDLGMFTVSGELVIRGRKKDTIVLRGGENVEPLPIEMKLNDSPYITTSVAVGQDERSLGVLIVPNREEVTAFAEEKGIPTVPYEDLLKNFEVLKLFEQEIHGAINAKNGFRMFERIGPFCLLPKEFETGRELSAKQEIARYRIVELYRKEIRAMFR